VCSGGAKPGKLLAEGRPHFRQFFPAIFLLFLVRGHLPVPHPGEHFGGIHLL